ncbi:MAG TPA: VOC family protein [Tepidisphaeraceae bacterium]|jgi:PhnB protein|nr:VOC family protein [Tepidisphaeraceae bacterium]
MIVNPYLSFDGRCDEAIEFYKSAVGAEVTVLMRFKDMPKSCSETGPTPGTENKVMHAALRIGDSTVFASDGRCSGQAKFSGICLSLAAPNDAQAERLFNALASGGKVSMPLGKTFFSSNFGMLTDRFGVPWMVLVQA